MRKIVPVLVVFVVLAMFCGTLGFLWTESRQDPVVYETVQPSYTDIVKKTVATGAIGPRNEVGVVSRVSGIVDRILVKPGQLVERGDLLATIRIIPDTATLSKAEATERSTAIERDDARRELDRARDLFERGVLARSELDRIETGYSLAHQAHSAAIEHLRIVKEGASSGSENVSTEIRATVAGMILDVPVEEGESVIEANTFNAGTTIASIADMRDLIFEGKIDESEVGKIQEGMDLDLTVGALADEHFRGVLEYISPKGILEQGAVQFEIKAAIVQKEGIFIRAGSSANADIVLDRRSEVLAVPESALNFDGEITWVEVETATQVFERRDVEVGLSDGIHIEVKSGLAPTDKVKKQDG